MDRERASERRRGTGAAFARERREEALNSQGAFLQKPIFPVFCTTWKEMEK